MNVELKRLQVFARMSEETTAFAADVWINGKKAGTAKNNGHGGCSFVCIDDPALAAELRTHGVTLIPNEYRSERYTPDGAEWLVDLLVEQHLNAKKDKRVAKAITKNDNRAKASCAQRGTHAARFKLPNQSIIWVEFKDEEVGRQNAESKHGSLTDWTVIA